tara:strand:+ start:1543 stop:1959 length:417 start_codon:yes stop_codon:yes gene_type:complete
MPIIQEITKVIKLADLLSEAKVDGMVFVNKWKKALQIIKQKGGWSPHLRKSSKSEPIGYTNSDFWNKVPRKWEGKTVIGYHDQALSRAMSRGGQFWEKPMLLNWSGDAKLIHKVLRKAGFKSSGGRNEDDKIIIKPSK